LENVNIRSYRLQESEIQELEATVRTACPELQFFELGAQQREE
jgi:hypothetical protein